MNSDQTKSYLLPTMFSHLQIYTYERQRSRTIYSSLSESSEATTQSDDVIGLGSMKAVMLSE